MMAYDDTRRLERSDMKRTVIITAKIADEYAKLILSGEKHYEVRDSSLEGADAIHFESSSTGIDLGTYRLLSCFAVDRDKDPISRKYSMAPDDQFDELFPPVTSGGPATLWVARLGERINLEDLIRS